MLFFIKYCKIALAATQNEPVVEEEKEFYGGGYV